MENLIEYNVNESYIAKAIDKYKDIILMPDDKDSYAIVMSGLKAHREIRLAIEKKRKSNNETAKTYIEANNSRAKELHALNDPGEQRLKDIRKAEDDRITEIEAEKERIEKERVDSIFEKIQWIKNHTLNADFITTKELTDRLGVLSKLVINEVIFMEFIEDTQKALTETVGLLDVALAERTRLDKEDADRKAEAERLEKIQAEQETKELEIKAAQDRVEASQRKIDEENQRIEAEKKAEQERKKREEFERKAKEEAQVQAKKDVAENARREELEKAERERQEKEDAAQQEALKPDKKKLLEFADSLRALPSPNLKSVEASEILSRAVTKISEIADGIKTGTGRL